MKTTFSFKIQKVGSNGWETLDLSIEDYLDLEPEESPRIDSVAQYLNLYEYGPWSPDEIAFIEVVLEIEEDRRVIKQSFWNEGNSMAIELQDTGRKPYHLLILSSRFHSTDNFVEIIRLVEKVEKWVPVYHGRIFDLDDGTQMEEKLDVAGKA